MEDSQNCHAQLHVEVTCHGPLVRHQSTIAIGLIVYEASCSQLKRNNQNPCLLNIKHINVGLLICKLT